MDGKIEMTLPLRAMGVSELPLSPHHRHKPTGDTMQGHPAPTRLRGQFPGKGGEGDGGVFLTFSDTHGPFTFRDTQGPMAPATFSSREV